MMEYTRNISSALWDCVLTILCVLMAVLLTF